MEIKLITQNNNSQLKMENKTHTLFLYLGSFFVMTATLSLSVLILMTFLI